MSGYSVHQYCLVVVQGDFRDPSTTVPGESHRTEEGHKGRSTEGRVREGRASGLDQSL